MQYKAKTPDEYLNNLEDDWRKEKLEVIRNYICSNAAELQEGIQYSMLSYGNNESALFHLNAQKNYVSLYVGDIEKIENGKELLEGFSIGKGCIRIKKSNDLSSPNLEKFIVETINTWRAGKDLDC